MIIKVSSVLVNRNRWNPLEIYVLKNKSVLNINYDGDGEKLTSLAVSGATA
jgi:hypothetical protein